MSKRPTTARKPARFAHLSPDKRRKCERAERVKKEVRRQRKRLR